ncbi:hypothetical protein QBC34DRAFT_75513 [Podospora aff. communis PSN243]|uniref:F-box domain-containing protein n=1 Tax=Podospora aff. communis PSN243 TaxID=3040156 RepID=A0AAV9GP61_9PEZI|nr:hypothetical protein QBC34DRAFT_75513 [Podospora aff. communis PSN243]
MARLIQLPAEILREICSYLCLHCSAPCIVWEDPEPADTRDPGMERSAELCGLRHPTHNLAALSRTCRRLHDIAQPYLYHCIRWAPEPPASIPVLDLARQFLVTSRIFSVLQATKPDVAQRVQAAELDCVYIGPILPSSKLDVAFNRADVYPRGYVLPSDLNEALLETILLSLPALKALRLRIFDGLSPSFRLWTGSATPNLGVLPTLRELYAHSLMKNRGWWPRLKSLLKMTDGITVLSIQCFHGFGNESLDELRNLVELTIDSCEFKALALTKFIESADHLRAFRMLERHEDWSKYQRPAVYPNPWPCYASIVAALGKHKSTLRSLGLLIRVRSHGHMGDPAAADVDFRDFEKLENLCVRLMDLRCSAPERVGEMHYEIAQNLKSLEPSDPRCQDGYLASILPRSIKRLYFFDALHPKNSVAILSANLWGLDTALKRGDFPNLEEIGIISVTWERTLSSPALVARGEKPCPAAAGRLRKLGRTWAERGGAKLINTPAEAIILGLWN